jgi:RNA polymerase-binding transcription factor DksA
MRILIYINISFAHRIKLITDSSFSDEAEMIPSRLTGQVESQLQRRRKYILDAIRSHQYSTNQADQAHSRHCDADDVIAAELLTDAEIALLLYKQAEPKKIQAALRRIKSHTYGICTACGATIAPQRLQIHPTAERCRHCQAEMENSQRQGTEPGA